MKEKKMRYFEGIGRRKTSVARVRISEGDSREFIINGKKIGDYFDIKKLIDEASSPLSILKLNGKFNVSAKVSGGGISSQAEAVRLGLARAIVKFDDSFKSKLRAVGYLTRDPRVVERKKYGFKKARRAPQWQKR